MLKVHIFGTPFEAQVLNKLRFSEGVAYMKKILKFYISDNLQIHFKDDFHVLLKDSWKYFMIYEPIFCELSNFLTVLLLDSKYTHVFQHPWLQR